MTVVVGGVGWQTHRARTQRRAIAAIQAAGGTVMFNHHEQGPRSWSSAGKPRGPAWLRKAIGPEYFDRAVYVGLFRTPADDSWIDAVNQLGTVKTLLLSGDNVDDATLERLAPSTALLELHLTGSRVTDQGLGQLAKFPHLRWLVLNNTKVSDAGLKTLVSLDELEELNLRSTSVTDEGVATLKSSLPQITVDR